jgi:lipopolysaccharide transport system ATP-binding protein
MSSDIAISVKGISKAYTIAHGALKRPTFRDVVMQRMRHPFRRPRCETFWALNDVSFDVKQGEVVGIIGRNGAGKSTLLKILSRITEPTAGRIELYGRVGSLLEVGTGFHPELTGRENVFLNGAILGMTRAEIRKQFDAIVDFAEVEKFIDTPVKRYSSGMYVRLAFAVAAHLNPEILIVDEVLAVGDAEFQKKCLGKMGDVAKGGRTVLFVSHNMAAVERLCGNVLELSGGNVVTMGPTENVVKHYMQSSSIGMTEDCVVEARRYTLSGIRISGERNGLLTPLAPASVTLLLRAKADAFNIGVHIIVEDETGYPVLGLDSMDLRNTVSCRQGQNVVVTFRLASLPFAPGSYRLHIWLKSDADHDSEEIGSLFPFEVTQTSVYGNRELSRRWHGTAVTKASVDVTVEGLAAGRIP